MMCLSLLWIIVKRKSNQIVHRYQSLTQHYATEAHYNNFINPMLIIHSTQTPSIRPRQNLHHGMYLYLFLSYTNTPSLPYVRCSTPFHSEHLFKKQSMMRISKAATPESSARPPSHQTLVMFPHHPIPTQFQSNSCPQNASNGKSSPTSRGGYNVKEG